MMLLTNITGAQVRTLNMNVCVGTNFCRLVGSCFHSVREQINFIYILCSSLHRISRLEPVR